jgi:hypothetical protein
MRDLVDIAIPANAQAAAEALGLKVSRNVVSGVRVRQIEREDALIAIEFLRDCGFLAWRARRTAKARWRRSNAQPSTETANAGYGPAVVPKRSEGPLLRPRLATLGVTVRTHPCDSR